MRKIKNIKTSTTREQIRKKKIENKAYKAYLLSLTDWTQIEDNNLTKESKSEFRLWRFNLRNLDLDKISDPINFMKENYENKAPKPRFKKGNDKRIEGIVDSNRIESLERSMTNFYLQSKKYTDDIVKETLEQMKMGVYEELEKNESKKESSEREDSSFKEFEKLKLKDQKDEILENILNDSAIHITVEAFNEAIDYLTNADENGNAKGSYAILEALVKNLGNNKMYYANRIVELKRKRLDKSIEETVKYFKMESDLESIKSKKNLKKYLNGD